MGTNYYLEFEACAACGHPKDRMHIGKSSMGWVFALHVYPDKGIRDLPDWVALFDKTGTRIVDEYRQEIGTRDMLLKIVGRIPSGPQAIKPDSWYAENHAVPGPYGLARSKISGLGSAAHGPGTYDLHDHGDQTEGW